MNNPYEFKSTLDIDYKLYVVRNADKKLEENLKEGKLCYIFNARKLGKSSLIMRVVNNLENNKYICIYFEFSSLMTSEKEWFNEILCVIIRELKNRIQLNFSLEEWNQKFPTLNSRAVMREFFVYLSNQDFQDYQKIILFIDEVDRVKNYNFSPDNFFSLIREIVNNKTIPNIFNFCLVGAAKVSDLIRNRIESSFNLGQAIELTGFKLEKNDEITKELAVLITPQLKEKAENPEKFLKAVIKRTNGHPFLTQKLLYLTIKHIKEKISNDDEYSTLIQLEEEHIVKNWKDQDNPDHLKTIEDRILNSEERKFYTREQRKAVLLNLYKKILESKDKEIEIETLSPNERLLVEDLELSGLVISSRNKLKPFCLLYQEIFNLEWIEKKLDKIIKPWYIEKKIGWVKSNTDDKDRRDRSYLLYGQQLKFAQEEYMVLRKEDEAFIEKSKVCYHADKDRISKDWFRKLNEEEKGKIIDKIRDWTNYERKIFDSIIQELDNYNIDFNNLSIDDKNNWIDSFIENNIILNYEKIKVLKYIDDYIVNLENQERFNILIAYGKILAQHKIKCLNTNHPLKTLLDLGLVKKIYNLEDDSYYFQVNNPIYKETFNLNRTDSKDSYIERLLPKEINGKNYGKKLGMWLITKDDQFLLSREEFLDNIEFLNNDISQEENEFLLRSQILNW